MIDKCSSPDTLAPDESQRRGQLLLRTLPILLIPLVAGAVTGLILRFGFGVTPPARPESALPLPLILIVVMIVFFSALIMLVRLGRTRLSTLLLIAAWTLLTTFMALQGGVNTVWPALLIAPICAAGLLIDGVASISLAGLATVFILALGWLDWNGLSPNSPLKLIAQGFEPVFATTFWVSTFWTIAALTSLLARGLQSALQESRAHAQTLSDLSAQLEVRVAQQTAQLVEQEREAARLEERTRVARDIHDTLAQGLTGIVVQLGAAERALAVASPDATQHLDLAKQLARESLAEARRSIWNLRANSRAPMTQNAKLGEALQSLTVHPLANAVKVTFTQQGEAYALSTEAESALLRVCQEALANVAKHANARSVFITLEYAETCVRLCVGDDGQGFGAELLEAQGATPSPTGGFGLLGMRERLQALGGQLKLQNDVGARVLAEVPR